MTNITVSYPNNFTNERVWIIDVILHEFLGISYQSEASDINHIELAKDDKKIILSDRFFSNLHNNWLKFESMPRLPLKLFNCATCSFLRLSYSSIPILYGDNVFIVNNNKIKIGIDVFGSAFFMLSRYEELIVQERDKYIRFQAISSVAFKAGFIDRPIINEYLEIFKFAIKKLWPKVAFKKRQFRTMISCDVDQPYQCGTKNLAAQLRTIAADLGKRKNPKRAIMSFINYFFSKIGVYKYDIHYQNLLWMINVNKQIANNVTFNFIVDHSSKDMDGCYNIREPALKALILSIYQNGHSIGLHSSFNSYKDEKQLAKEVHLLKSILVELGIDQQLVEQRQHYLRWDSGVTPSILGATDLHYDTTLGFSDHAGFRCGICYEFPLYDLRNRKALSIFEYPLIAMDCSVVSPLYMNLGLTEKALKTFISYKKTCKQYDGNFVFLWHNSFFGNTTSYKIYQELIAK